MFIAEKTLSTEAFLASTELFQPTFVVANKEPFSYKSVKTLHSTLHKY
jgi:hypothetical protein